MLNSTEKQKCYNLFNRAKRGTFYATPDLAERFSKELCRAVYFDEIDEFMETIWSGSRIYAEERNTRGGWLVYAKLKPEEAEEESDLLGL